MTDMNRRNFLKGAGAAVAAGLAGCTDSSPGADYENDEPENSGPSYDLEFSINGNIDLTELSTSELSSLDDIRSEDYVELEYKLLEDGEEVEPEHIELILEGENEEQNSVELGPEVDNAYQIGCYELLEGENTVTAKAEVDGETVKANDTTEKKTPGTYRAEVKIDGKNFDEYTTPYNFDTVNVDTEEYQKLRQESINQNAWNEKVVQPTLENDKVDFEPDFSPSDFWLSYSHGQSQWSTKHFEDLGRNNLQNIVNDAGIAFQMHYSKEKDGRAGISADMNHNAATTMTLVDRHINEIPEGENRYDHEKEIDLEGGHFSSVGHGHALFYERNTEQWIEQDPKRVTVSEPANAPDVDKNDRFYAPIEYMTGMPEDHDGVHGYHRKKIEGLRSIGVTTQIPDILYNDFDADDHWIQQNTSKIGRNEPLGEDTENILRATMQTAYKTEDKMPIIYGGDTNNDKLLVTENEEIFNRFRSHDNPEPVTTQEVETEMLT